jgi:ABC-type transporter MlaC component
MVARVCSIGHALVPINRTVRQLLLALTAAAFAVPAHAVEVDGAVSAFVDRINATVAPVAPGDGKAIRAACATLVSQAFNIGAMAPDIVPEAWVRMDAGQRAAYSRGLAKRAADDCVSHGGEIAGNTVELVGVRAGEGGDRLIAVKQSKGRGRTVIWRVRRGSGGALKAVDMTVDGRSLVASARSDAKAILKKTDGNVVALLRSVGE